MTPTTWSRLEEIFHGAVELDGSQRDRFIEDRCADRPDLARGVRRLLEDHARAGAEFIEPPPRHDDGEPPLVGRRIRAYTIVRLIGTGGMGGVYEASQENPRRAVALKLLRAGWSTPEGVRRFRDEATILARLSHPAIAQVYEAGETEDGAPFYAMELIEGARPITSYAAEQSLALEARLGLFLEVCDAVGHAHQKGVIHRDLKPGNILVSAAGRPKVIDFGVARVLDDSAVSATVTHVRQFLGTLASMSPEQCEGSADVDVRSDVYSLGVVLYELLCGKPPHDLTGLPLAEATRVIREMPARRLSAVRPGLRGDLETIVLKALEKERHRRYQSVGELAADLGRFLAHEPIAARPGGALYAARMFVRRNRLLVGVGAAVVLSVVVGAGVSLVFAVRAAREARRAERINAFMMGALSSANPLLAPAVSPETLATDYEPWADWRQNPWPFSGQAGSAATAGDIVRAAAARVHDEFADDPLAEATLSDTLGVTLFRLRSPREAEELLRRAHALRRAVLGELHEDTTRSALHLAEVLDAGGDINESQALYRAALDATRRTDGPFDARTLRIERMLANNLWQHHARAPEARAMLDQTLARAEAAGAFDTPAVLSHAAYAADMRSHAGDLGAAQALARRAYAGLHALLGDADIRTAEAAEALAGLTFGSPGEADEAGRLSIIAVEAKSRAFGPASTQAVASRMARAYGLGAAGRFEQAADEWAEVARGYGQRLGERDFETLRAHGEMARALVRGNVRLDEAENHARLAADWMSETHGRRTGYSIAYRALQAEAIGLAGRAAEAATIFDQVVGDSENPDHTVSPGLVVSVLVRAGHWLLEAGQARRAQEVLGAALAHPALDAQRRAQVEEELRRAAGGS